MIISKSQSADMLGLSRQRISQLITEGIAIEAEGGIDAVKTARNYVRRLNKKEASPLPRRRAMLGGVQGTQRSRTL